MPWIKPELRNKYLKILKQLPEIETKGDLEYCVIYLAKKFMSTREFRYSPLHACTYAIIHAGEEFKRLYLDKRENTAKKKNGDIKIGG